MTRSVRLQCPAGRAPGVVPGALHPFLAQSSISRDHWSRLLPALPSVKTAELYCDPLNATLTGLVSNLCGAWIFACRIMASRRLARRLLSYSSDRGIVGRSSLRLASLVGPATVDSRGLSEASRWSRAAWRVSIQWEEQICFRYVTGRFSISRMS